MKRAIFLFLLSVFVFACNTSTETKAERTLFLNTVWTLESFNFDGKTIRPPADQVYAIQFKDDSTFSGNSDCLPISGPFTVEADHSIYIKPKGTAFINCGSQSLFLFFARLIGTAERYETSKNKLDIYCRNDTLLIFTGK